MRIWIDKPDVHLIIEALKMAASRHESQSRATEGRAMAAHDKTAANMRRLRVKLQDQVLK
jgi:hypothetical protein